MKFPRVLQWLFVGIFPLVLLPAFAADIYTNGLDSKPQTGVPKADVLKFTLENSKIFPGTRHDYWVYVPAEYDGSKPACVFVCQDGINYNAPAVFDKLIASKEMPVTIGIFVRPGIVPASNTNGALDRFNRSYEYDGLGDNYARFLLEEIFPQVEQITLPDGRAVHLSKDPNDRCIAGQSSGGICAFTVAWERPDQFRRVFSAIGTFVDLRGGSRYPSLIRKFEPKPIRLFLQDGSNDNNKYGGDWWMANQTMQRALVFAGYDVTNIWGTGTHSGAQASAIFPDVMRWLWRDWPQPIQAGKTLNDTLTNILIPGEDWQLAAETPGGADGPAVNARGEVFFSEVRSNRIWKIKTDGQLELFSTNIFEITGTAVGSDGKIYSVGHSGKVFATAMEGNVTEICDGLRGNDLCVAHNGNIYATESAPAATNGQTKVWLVKTTGRKTLLDDKLKFANGIALSPDQSLLYVSDYKSHWVYCYVIRPDGTLADKQKYYWLHERDVDDDAGADGMRVDRAGRLYVTTRMGIQVCDQAGRVQCILPTPNGKVNNLTFGGAKFDTLYATCGDKVFKRKLNVTGANGWAEPNKPAPPRL
jgi:sugar lactone lactonase YvrE